MSYKLSRRFFDSQLQLSGFVVTPIGVMHAETHRKMVERMRTTDLSARALLLPAKPFAP